MFVEEGGQLLLSLLFMVVELIGPRNSSGEGKLSSNVDDDVAAFCCCRCCC